MPIDATPNTLPKGAPAPADKFYSFSESSTTQPDVDTSCDDMDWPPIPVWSFEIDED